MRFIFSISILIISGILFFTVVNPLYSDVSDLRKEVAAYNLALNNSTELQKTRDSLVDTYKNIKEEDRDRLEHFLPNTVNNIKFILEVERIANLHSMSLKNIKFDPPKTGDSKMMGTAGGSTSTGGTLITTNDPSASKPYGVFPVEFTTEGNYSTFVLFLKDLEHNLRLVDIKSISFTVPNVDPKQGAQIDPNIFTYTLKVETYWLK